MSELFNQIFWDCATQLVQIFVPVIVLTLIFKIIYKFIIRGGE